MAKNSKKMQTISLLTIMTLPSREIAKFLDKRVALKQEKHSKKKKRLTSKVKLT
jgi:hypothetical protein